MFANAVYYWRNYILSAPISFLTLSTFYKNRENAYVFVVLYIVFNRGFITGGYIYIGLVSYHSPYTVYGV